MNGARLRRTLAAWGAAVLAAIVAAGCAGPNYVYFRPAPPSEVTSPTWVTKGAPNPSAGSGFLDVNLSARGVVSERKDQAPQEALEVELSVGNRGGETFRLDPGQVRLMDDEGKAITGAEVAAGTPATGPIELAAGQKGTFTLVLQLPQGDRFEDIGSLRLIWPYRYGDAPYEAETKFIKVEQVNHYYPSYYDPWYDPWYGPAYYPYPYGPYGPWWGHFNFSLGYTYHHHHH